MFSENLTRILSELHATGADIAGYGDFDRTNISRFKSGARTCRAGSPIASHLVDAICLYADKNEKTQILYRVLELTEDTPEKQLKEALSGWLFDDEPVAQRSSRKKSAGRSFSERLEQTMSLSGISNSQLSRLINVDASLISRYRSGVRMPKANTETAQRLSDVLFHRIKSNNNLSALSGIMDFPTSEIDESFFSTWLYDFDVLHDTVSSAAEKLLDTFDSYRAYSGTDLTGIAQTIPKELITDTKEVYFGNAGLQNAVIRFLAAAIENHVPRLYLYSDQNVEWLFGDNTFRLRWAALMSACIKNGTRIRIIHNIDRNLNEMIGAISGWLPLYMSGMIEPYYCRMAVSGRFSHTIFLCPDIACIEACHVVGTENDGFYRYHTDPEFLNIFHREFTQLMKGSDPLIKFKLPDPSDNASSDIHMIQNTLSFATMPDSLVDAFSDTALYEKWRSAKDVLYDLLEKKQIYEYVSLASEKDLTGGLVTIEKTSGIRDYGYTPSQYALHLQNMIRLAERFPNYHICVLPENPFPNIRILSGKSFVSISHAMNPALFFTFTHSLLCNAFTAYTTMLKESSKTDREALHSLRSRLQDLTE